MDALTAAESPSYVLVEPEAGQSEASLPPVDAVVSISVSGDRLKAFLSISPPENGGAAPTLESLRIALAEHGVCFGVDERRLAELSESPAYGRMLLIAQGRAPENGKDGSFTLQVHTEKDGKPRERADGTVDYHDLGLVENVRKGQLLCDIMLPTEGRPG
jgi:uncharacterized protein (DUF342 family)